MGYSENHEASWKINLKFIYTFNQASRSSGLNKTILQGTVKGGRKQGRQKKRWEDDIRQGTSLDFAKSQRAMENRFKKDQNGGNLL